MLINPEYTLGNGKVSLENTVLSTPVKWLNKKSIMLKEAVSAGKLPVVAEIDASELYTGINAKETKDADKIEDIIKHKQVLIKDFILNLFLYQKYPRKYNTQKIQIMYAIK